MAIFFSCHPTRNLPATNPTTTNTPVMDSPKIATATNDPFFEKLLSAHPELKFVLRDKDISNIQIVYTRINRSPNQEPHLEHHYFNTSGNAYFYPASTVKLPILLLALQKLNELKDKGIDANSTMITGSDFSGQTETYNEPNSPDGRPTIATYIKKILLVSDNDAYNRLYEFLGQEYIQRQLELKGYTSANIWHRLEVFLSEEENRHTNPIRFYDTSGNLLYEQPGAVNRLKQQKRNDFLGKGYYSNGNLVLKPMDFSRKNRLSLSDLHTILQSVIFPSTLPLSRRFNITEADRNMVLKYMSASPRETIFPAYDSSYGDTYSKFLFYGAEQKLFTPGIRIFNKEGDAYGQLTDASYFVDFNKGVEFLLSATIYCNEDGILNDDKYDYNNVGLPFMKNLGKAVYEYELGRKRETPPDLSPFIFTYGN